MKTYTTSQVVRRLERHPDWAFEAPTIGWKVTRSRAKVITVGGERCVAFEREGQFGWEWCLFAPIRSDWRLVSPKCEKRETVEFDYEHSVNRCLRIEDGQHTISAIIPPSEMTAGKWHIVATRVK